MLKFEILPLEAIPGFTVFTAPSPVHAFFDTTQIFIAGQRLAKTRQEPSIEIGDDRLFELENRRRGAVCAGCTQPATDWFVQLGEHGDRYTYHREGFLLFAVALREKRVVTVFVQEKGDDRPIGEFAHGGLAAHLWFDVWELAGY